MLSSHLVAPTLADEDCLDCSVNQGSIINLNAADELGSSLSPLEVDTEKLKNVKMTIIENQKN